MKFSYRVLVCLINERAILYASAVKAGHDKGVVHVTSVLSAVCPFLFWEVELGDGVTADGGRSGEAFQLLRDVVAPEAGGAAGRGIVEGKAMDSG